jgi:hypothetical protein
MEINDLSAMRAAIIEKLGKMSLKRILARRKEKDGSLTYQAFLDKVDKVKEETLIYIKRTDDTK